MPAMKLNRAVTNQATSTYSYKSILFQFDTMFIAIGSLCADSTSKFCSFCIRWTKEIFTP